MTAIRAAIKPTRRPGELGVHSVDRFHFAVPDLAVAKNFYGEFGLEIDEKGGLLAMKTPGTRMSGSPSARVRARSLDISRSARSTTILIASPSGSRSSASSGSIRRASKRTACGFTITTATWLKSRSRRNPRPTRSLISQTSLSARASAARRSDVKSSASRPGGWRISSCSRATSRRRFSSIRAPWACAFPTGPATASPFCTASTAATII
jgi:hypothetical protein